VTEVERIVTGLRAIDPRALPAAARAIYAERVARRLKVAADGPLPESALLILEAWPVLRLRDLDAALDAIAAEIERDRNDRWNDEVRTRVARTYL
jgi:hypothetical protein